MRRRNPLRAPLHGVLALALALSLALAYGPRLAPGPVHRAGALQPIAPLFGSYAGIEYPAPEQSWSGCSGYWTWTQSCYTSTCSGTCISTQNVVQDDINFIKANGLGRFIRLWVSINQMIPGGITTYAGIGSYSNTSLANFDDALSRYVAAGIQLDIVLLTDSHGTTGFNANVLDGNHDTDMNNYASAVGDLMTHIAGNATDSKAVAVADLCNECYGQLDQYYTCGTGANCTAPFPHLGIWQNSNGNLAACLPTIFSIGNMANITASPCSRANAEANLNTGVTTAGHGCENTGLTAVVTTCVDINLIFPWLVSLYTAAHAADPNVLYTISTEAGSAGPMATSLSAYVNQAFYLQEYPVDLYDLHLYAGCGLANCTNGSGANPAYSDGPWDATWNARLHAVGDGAGHTSLPHPWISGEAGCGGGNNSCTYTNGTTGVNLGIDQWWLNNAWEYGDQAVMIEAAVNTLWQVSSHSTPNTVNYTISDVGQEVAYANGAGATSRHGLGPRGR